MWFSVVCTLINYEYASSQWSKCCGLTRRNKFWPWWWRMSLSIRVRQRQTKFDLFFTTISSSKKCLFQRQRAEKGIAWQVDVCSVIWTLIDNGNQITRLLAIVVKIQLSGVSINFEAVGLSRVNDFCQFREKQGKVANFSELSTTVGANQWSNCSPAVWLNN